MKRLSAVLLSAALLLTLCSCGGPSAPSGSGASGGASGQDVYHLTIGTYNPEASADGVAANAFESYIEEHSGGRIQVDVYHNSVLGDAQTQIEAVTMGTQDFFIPGMELLTSYDPLFNVPQTYFLFESVDQLRAFYNSDLFAQAITNLENQNILLMDKSWMGQQGPFRSLVSTGPLDSYDDLVGDRFRVYDAASYVAAWEAFETATYVVSYSEIYMALEQGMIESFEVPFNTIRTNSFCDVAKYVTKFESYYQLYNIIGNKNKVESLPQDLQQVVYEGSTYAMQAYADNVQENLQSDLDYLVNELGVTYNDQMDYTPFREKMPPIYEQLIANGDLPEGIVEYVAALEY